MAGTVNDSILQQFEAFRQQHESLSADVKALRHESETFERRIAVLEAQASAKAALPKAFPQAAPPAVSAAAEVPAAPVAAQPDVPSPPIFAHGRIDPTLFSDTAQPVVDTVPTPSPALVPESGSASVNQPAEAEWAMDMGRLEMYEIAFRKADQDGDGYANPMEVKTVMERSGIPNSEMKSIWLLVDIEQRRTGLNFAEFACAMYIAFRRAKQDIPIPVELPARLRAIAASGIATAGDAGTLVAPTAAAAPGIVGYSPSSPISASAAAADDLSPSQKLQERLKAMEQQEQAASATQSASQSTASAVPVFFESGSVSTDPFDDALSVKELKARLKNLGADFTGLAEKCELLALLKQTEAKKQVAGGVPLVTAPLASEPLVAPPARKPEDDPFAGLI